jgi:hypothetical protein
MGIDEFLRLRVPLVELARNVDVDAASIGTLPAGGGCAVAPLLSRLDLLDGDKRPCDALEWIGPVRETAVRSLHGIGWRQ